MITVHGRAELVVARRSLPGPVAVVLTMGALHEGHAALIDAARADVGAVVVTVFVNPLQFGPGEDLARYPRTLEADCELCSEHGVAVVFAPESRVVYPTGEPQVRVSAGPVGDRFEGASRSGHFDGVLTVVLKLLNLVQPDVAAFGEKDAQQLFLTRRMVSDLDLPVRVLGVPTSREHDGLAYSSRNRYLSAPERTQARALFSALDAGAAAAADGPAAVRRVATAVLAAADAVQVDYLALVDETTFSEVAEDAGGPARLLVAARVGDTRLIDNVPVVLGTPSG